MITSDLCPIASKAYKDIVGQTSVLRQLDFYIQSYIKTRIVPHLILVAPKGCGKTTIARATAKALQKVNSEKKGKYVSCAGFGKATVEQFYTQLVAPNMVDQDVTFIFDECHNLSSAIQEELLSILNPNPRQLNTTTFEGQDYEFNFTRLTFVFATTEPHMMKDALMDRLTRIELEEYELHHLAKIVNNNLAGYKVSKQVLEKISSTLRGNARSAQKTSDEILRYLQQKSKKTLTIQDWKTLCNILNIHPLGLSKTEVNILRVLSHVSHMRLTQLSSVTGVNRNALQKDVETYLQKKRLISIETKGRSITGFGITYLREVDKLKQK